MRFVLHSVVAAAASAAGSTSAQTAPAELEPVYVQGKRDRDPLQLDTPTAGTATRLGLTPRETPASVEILTQEEMRQRGSRTLTEALRTAPGVTGGNPPSAPTTISTRGFTSLLYLYDGVRTSGAGAVNRVEDTWNYDRIELLKGAASVLYGDTAIGGTINFVTRRPDRSRESREALLSYGSHDSYRAAVGLGGALGDSAAYRLDYSHNRTNVGIVPRDGERLDHLTTGLAFDLGSRTRLDLSLDYLHDDNQGYFGTPLVPATFATEPTNVVSTPDGRVIDRRIAHQNYNVADNKNGSTTYVAHAGLTHRLSSEWTLRNVLTFNHADRTFKNSESAVFTAPNLVTRDQTLITHDQRFWFDRADATYQGTLLGVENRFVAGAEYGKTRFGSMRRFSNSTPGTLASLRVPALDPGTTTFDESQALGTGGGNRVDTESDVRNLAVFAEDAVKIISPLTVVLGVRNDRIDVDRGIHDLNLATTTEFSTQYRSTSYRLGTVYELDESSNLYAQYTNATIPVSTLFLLSAGSAPYPLSKGRQVEVGWKQSLGGRRFEWTAALYRITLENALSRDEANPNMTVNNGKQSSRGAELSAAWRPVEPLTLAANFAALRAKFDTLIEGGGVSRVGNRPPNVPERVANVFATYRVDGLPIELFLGVNRTGPMYTDNANTIRINGYTTADAAVSYRAGPGVYSLRVRNLTDKLYATYGGRAASQVLIAPLRTFELSARFDL